MLTVSSSPKPLPSIAIRLPPAAGCQFVEPAWPITLTSLPIVTFSVYVPASTLTVPFAETMFTPRWIEPSPTIPDIWRISDEGIIGLNIDESLVRTERQPVRRIELVDVVQDAVFDGEGLGHRQAAGRNIAAADRPGGAGAVGSQERVRIVRSEFDLVPLGAEWIEAAEQRVAQIDRFRRGQ